MRNDLYHFDRGGSWLNLPSDAQVARRLKFASGDTYFNLGVRLIRLINPLQQIAEVKNGK